VVSRREQRMRIRWLGVVATIVGGPMLLGGCGGSSLNPQSSASYREAVHLDTLAVQASNAGQFDRYRLLSYPIAALAENLAPTAVTLSVDGASQNYHAVMLELVGQAAGSTTSAPSDSIFVVVAWSDSNADELVYTEISPPDTLADIADLSDTVANGALDSATVLSASLVAAKNHCHTFTLPLANAAVADFLSGTQCAAGTGTAAFTFYFTPSATNPHQTFALASQSIAAIRLLLPANTGGQDRIRQIRASVSRLR
jgi:hypothetical protein